MRFLRNVFASAVLGAAIDQPDRAFLATAARRRPSGWRRFGGGMFGMPGGLGSGADHDPWSE